MTTEAVAAVDAGAPGSSKGRGLRIAGRTALVMLLIAAIALVGIGIATLLLVDGPEPDRWLRYAFGRVFGGMAVAMGATLGIPAIIGLWAMAGAADAPAGPSLGPTTRRAIILLAAVPVLAVAGAMLVRGNGLSILDLGILGLVSLISVGLAAAAIVSPHRLRAWAAAIALALAALQVLSALGALIA